MSFVQQAPRLFTRQYVQTIRPGSTGVYGLFRQGVWIYIGKGDIRSRLLDHLNGDNPLILQQKPTHWVDEVWVDPHMSVREKELILLLQPLCNQKVG